MKILRYLFLFLAILGCGKSSTRYLSEVTIGESYVSMMRELNHLFDALSNRVESGDTCTREVNQACDLATDTQSITYTTCTILGHTYAGTVSVAYTPEAACTATDGANLLTLADTETAVRTINYTAIKSNSEFTITGTSNFTKTAGDILVDINMTKVLRESGTVKYSQDIDTTTNLDINSVARASRVIQSGVIKVVHNSDYTANYTFSNVTWNSAGSCCHPSSGSLSFSATGTVVNATGTISFVATTCGEATVNIGGTVSTVNFGACY